MFHELFEMLDLWRHATTLLGSLKTTALIAHIADVSSSVSATDRWRDSGQLASMASLTTENTSRSAVIFWRPSELGAWYAKGLSIMLCFR